MRSLAETPGLRPRSRPGEPDFFPASAGEAYDDDEMRRSHEHYFLLILSVVAVATVAGLGLFMDPDPRGYGTHEALGLEPCMPMELWNFPCPGCGVTTSVTLAAQGRPLASFVTQPFGLLLALGSVAFFAFAVVAQVRGRDLWLEVLTRTPWTVLMGGLCALVLAWVYKVWAVRNGITP